MCYLAITLSYFTVSEGGSYASYVLQSHPIAVLNEKVSLCLTLCRMTRLEPEALDN